MYNKENDDVLFTSSFVSKICYYFIKVDAYQKI